MRRFITAGCAMPLASSTAEATARGGASVLTIGSYGAPSEPTVSIVGLTITGGVRLTALT